MKYLLPCPACQREIAVESGQAGQLLQCTCGQQVEVPTVRQLRELKSFQEKGATPARWDRRKGFCFLGSAICAVGIILAAYIWLSWPVLYDAGAIAQEIQSQPPFVAFLRLQSLEPPMPTPATERVESAPQLVPSKKLLMQVEGMGPQNLAPQQAYVSYQHARMQQMLRQFSPIAVFFGWRSVEAIAISSAAPFIVVGGAIVALSFLMQGQRPPRGKQPHRTKPLESSGARRSGTVEERY